MKKIAFLLFGGPNSQDARTVAGLAKASIKRGLEVDIFIMYEGVQNSRNKEFSALADAGVKITACAHNSDEFKITKNEKFKYGSQYDNANFIAGVDKYVAFT